MYKEVLATHIFIVKEKFFISTRALPWNLEENILFCEII